MIQIIVSIQRKLSITTYLFSSFMWMICYFAGTNIDEIATLKSKLNENFDMGDLGDASHILGMHIV